MVTEIRNIVVSEKGVHVGAGDPVQRSRLSRGQRAARLSQRRAYVGSFG